MAYRKAAKNKILGIGLVIFISFLLFMWLLPRTGIDGWVYNAQEIDSIHVVRYSDFSYALISDHAEIVAISNQIKNCKRVEVKSIKASNEPFSIIMYSRKRKSDLDFLDGLYDGKIIYSNGVGYKNDKLWSLINKYYSIIGTR
jgi:hypothetical protein